MLGLQLLLWRGIWKTPSKSTWRMVCSSTKIQLSSKLSGMPSRVTSSAAALRSPMTGTPSSGTTTSLTLAARYLPFEFLLFKLVLSVATMLVWLYQGGEAPECGMNKGPSLDGIYPEGCFTKFSEVFTSNLAIVGGEVKRTTFILISLNVYLQPLLLESPWLSWPYVSWLTAWASGWADRDSLSRCRKNVKDWLTDL